MTYPDWICADCGNAHGHSGAGVCTWHRDYCDICGELEFVTEPRDYGHLDRSWRVARKKALAWSPAMRLRSQE